MTQLWLEISAGLAAIAIALFSMRPVLRRLYAPPRGKQRLRITWIVAASLMATGWALGSDHVILGLTLVTAPPAAGLLAMLLCRDAYNRARGLPTDYIEIPENLGPARRALFGLMGLGCAIAAVWLPSKAGLRGVEAIWVCGGLAAGFGAAAATGRLSPRMRERLGATDPHAALPAAAADETLPLSADSEQGRASR